MWHCPWLARAPEPLPFCPAVAETPAVHLNRYVKSENNVQLPSRQRAIFYRDKKERERTQTHIYTHANAAYTLEDIFLKIFVMLNLYATKERAFFLGRNKQSVLKLWCSTHESCTFYTELICNLDQSQRKRCSLVTPSTFACTHNNHICAHTHKNIILWQ